MNTDISLSNIRKQTRLALPCDDGYLFRLGIAIYGFASITSFMAEVTCHLNCSLNRTELQDKFSKQILESFRRAIEQNGNPKIEAIGSAVADLFETLNDERNDFSHSYPITNHSELQILHRRKDRDGKYFEITNDFLNSFISRLHDVLTRQSNRFIKLHIGFLCV